MAKNNRGPTGVGSSLPQIDFQTLSLDQNISPSIIGSSEADIGLTLSQKPVTRPVFTESEVGFAATIYFDVNSFLLDMKNYQTLLQLNKHITLHSLEIIYIEIEGHASGSGGAVFNYQLSEKRIESIYHLLKLNDKAYVVEKKPYGKTKLAMVEYGKGATLEYQRSKNRRVEIYGYNQLLLSDEEKSKIDLFPKEVFQKLPDDYLMQYMLRLPNVQAEKPNIIFEEYVKRMFDKIYDPTLGKLEKPLMESKIGDVLKFFGVKNIKKPLRDAAVNRLYDLVDQTALDPNAKKMLKESFKAAMKQNWNK